MANNLDSNSKDILTSKPVIEFQEPPRVEEFPLELTGPVPQTVDELNKKIDEVISDLNKVIEVSDFLQNKVDVVSKKVCIQLDPAADSVVISVIRRQFPEADSNCITYQMYKTCIDRLNAKYIAHHEKVMRDSSSEEALTQAMADPFSTILKQLNSPDGFLRHDLDPLTQVIQPIDSSKQQEKQLDELFEKIRPRVKKMIESTGHRITLNPNNLVEHLPPTE